MSADVVPIDGGQQPEEQPEQGALNLVEVTVDALGQAIKSNALRSAGSTEDADAALKFAQAASLAAQAISSLHPPVDPNKQAQVEADLTKHGADLAFREQDAAEERAHKLEVAKVSAAAKPQRKINVSRDGAGNMTGLTEEN